MVPLIILSICSMPLYNKKYTCNIQKYKSIKKYKQLKVQRFKCREK